MKASVSRSLVPVLLAATIPVTAAIAQSKGPARPAGPSPETLNRLQDGRIAMAKAALKLDDAQLKLWAPVEEQLRASFAERQKQRQARREDRQQGAAPANLADRLDQASQRMAARAERMKAFAAAFKPFYAALSDEQKAVAGVVLRQMQDGRGMGRHHRWAQFRGGAAPQQQ